MAVDPALQILRDIQTATLRNAARLPLKEDAQPVWQGLGYQIGGLRLVSPMGEISEVLKVPRVTALPGVKNWILGIANVRGRLIPIIDMHQYLDMAPTLPMAQWRVLVVERDLLVAGLLVEQSLGIQHFQQDSFEEASFEALGPLEHYVRGAFRHGGRVFYEATLRAILEDERFFDVAERTN
ncbi:MAG: chemotaxis protein CheW [Pseudomonadales bacterium]